MNEHTISIGVVECFPTDTGSPLPQYAGSVSTAAEPRTAQTDQVSETSTYSSISFPSGSRT